MVQPAAFRCRAIGAVGCALLAAVAGCASCPTACDRACVGEKLLIRTGHDLGERSCPGEIMLPNGASLEGSIGEDEAVLIALWNNGAFQELLTELEMAQGDLVQAGLLPNPEIVYFFPVSDKPFKYALEFPIESLWLRPIRVAAAERESYRTCERLTQAGLDLIRNVRQAYSDVLLAEGRRAVAQEAVDLRTKVARIAETRLDAGDANPQEAATARIDRLLAEQDLVRARYEVDFAQLRLINWLGVGELTSSLALAADAPIENEVHDLDVDSLTAEAIESRPDSQGVEQLVAAAQERLRLAEVSWLRFLGILDATSGTRNGHEFGPAFRTTLPLFNTNEGVVVRAEAELERAARQRKTVHDQIMLEVRQAHVRYSQAVAEAEVLREQVQPEAEKAIRRAEAAYAEGDAPYVLVLETTRQLLDSRLRGVQIEADLRRSWAELERSVGRKL